MESLVLTLLTTFGIGFVALVLIRPWYGIIALVLTHIFLVASTEQVTIYERAYIIIFLSTLLGWFLKRLYLKDFVKIAKAKVSIPIFLFFVVGLISIFQAIRNGINIEDWLRDIWRFGPLLLFCVVVTEAKNLNQIKKLIILILIVGSIIATKNIVDLFYLKGSQEIFWEFRKTFEQHVSFFPFAALMLSTVLLFFIKEKKLMVFLYVIIFVCIFTPLALGFRSEIIAYILVIIVSISLRVREIGKPLPFVRISILLILFLAIFGSNYYLRQFMKQRFERRAILQGLYVRTIDWKTALSNIKENPIWGKGFGYGFWVDRIYEEHFTKIVHNLPLYLTLKMGITGPILFYSILFLALKSALSLFRNVHNQFQKGILGGIISYLMVCGFTSMIFSGFFRYEQNFLLGIFLGIISFYERMKRNNLE